MRTNARMSGGGMILATMWFGWAGFASAGQVMLDAAMSSSALLAGQKQTAYLRVAMLGFPAKEDAPRTPANLAIVLDKSGSMQGEKIEKAKEAAIQAIDRLKPDDVVSVIVYDSTVQVLVPATKVSDRDTIYDAIARIHAGGNTALFAGVSKGAREVRKFMDSRHANRIVLLSDGLANEGPSSSGQLAELGTSLGKEGIAVTTVGLGLDYNETLMTQLARASDGNHYFAEKASDLDRVYAAELGDVLSVVAQDVDVRVDCVAGIRPVRVLGRAADIAGQSVEARLNQIYGGQPEFLLLEVDVPPMFSGSDVLLANVTLDYDNMLTEAHERLTSRVAVQFTDKAELVAGRTNPEVMAEVARQIGAERNRMAMELRDLGKVEEARNLLDGNVAYLKENAVRYKDERLSRDAASNSSNAQNLDEKQWQRERKQMQAFQFEVEQSQKTLE